MIIVRGFISSVGRNASRVSKRKEEEKSIENVEQNIKEKPFSTPTTVLTRQTLLKPSHQPPITQTLSTGTTPRPAPNILCSIASKLGLGLPSSTSTPLAAPSFCRNSQLPTRSCPLLLTPATAATGGAAACRARLRSGSDASLDAPLKPPPLPKGLLAEEEWEFLESLGQTPKGRKEGRRCWEEV